MELLRVVILAIVQGIAEFLPISSSGHLSAFGQAFGFDPDVNMSLGVVLHGGTLLAIIIFYWQAIFRFLQLKRNKLALMIILGSVPAGVIGVALKKSGLAEGVFNSLWIVGCGFLFTGFMLQFAERRKRNLDESKAIDIDDLNYKQSLLIGCAQAFAILPGVSRSGSTISAGLLNNLKSAACAEFSFLLAIPAIGGAAFLEALDLLKLQGSGEVGHMLPLWMLLVGFAVSAVVGYFSLAMLLKVLSRGKMAIFSGYLYIMGGVVLGYQVINYLNR